MEDPQTLTPMPDGFYWKPRCHLDALPTGLFLHGEMVATMHQRIDGAWLARLHLEDGVQAPLITRRCTSFEDGRRGCEIWALRHEKALRKKVAIKLQWIQDNVVLRGRGRQLGEVDLTHTELDRALALPEYAATEGRGTWDEHPQCATYT